MQEIIAEYQSIEELRHCSTDEANATTRALKDKKVKVEIRGIPVGEGYKVISLGISSSGKSTGL